MVDKLYHCAQLGLPEGEDLNWVGQLFLLAVYGFILFRATVFIGDGSEKLLLLYGPGVIGGLVIPILGAVPVGAIVLFSGLGPDAQRNITVGVGTLVGSTIMLLTLPWAGSVILGARDYDAAIGKAALTQRGKPKFTNGLSLADSCVTASSNVPVGAKVMIATAISYLIVAIPAAKNKGNVAQLARLPALAGLFVCAVAFFGYSIYQVYSSSANQTAAQKTALLAKGTAAAGGYQAVSDEKQKEHAMLSLETEDDFEDLELVDSSAPVLCDNTWFSVRTVALCMLGFGTLLCVIFSGPMVAVICNYSNTITVPAFYVSFIVTPIASNVAEICRSLIFAAKKTEEGVSVGFSALYGAVCMNNTFVFGIFCVLIYVQKLKWTFMAETMVVLLTIIVVGINGMKETIFVWQVIPVVIMFPLSLLLVVWWNPATHG